jgi:uncharacterized RDD family membrane protein YckC
MSNTSIHTAQNVNINYAVASLGYRIVAFLIDLVIIILYVLLVEYIGLGMRSIFDANTTIGLSELLILPVVFYSLLFNIIFNGKTPGKFIMRIKVVKMDGSPASWSDFLITWIMRLIDIWVSTGGAGILSIIFTDKNQRLGDSAANTIVIDSRKKTKVSHTILEEVEESYEPQFLVVSQLSDHEINEIKEIYRLAGESRDYATLKMLREKIETLLNLRSDLKDAIFVRTILKDYSYLTQGQ